MQAPGRSRGAQRASADAARQSGCAAAVASWAPNMASGPEPCPLGTVCDAVKIRLSESLSITRRLRRRALLGPVIVNALDSWAYWLVPAGTAQWWRVEDSTALGLNAWISVPPVRWPAWPGLYWLTPVREWSALADPEDLRRHLEEERSSSPRPFAPR